MLRAYFYLVDSDKIFPMEFTTKERNYMFTRKDISQIDRDYFVVNATTLYNICMVSKNTNHSWIIQPRTINGHRSLIILHRHGTSGEYHTQPYFHPRSILQAQELIKSAAGFHTSDNILITIKENELVITKKDIDKP